MCIFIVFEGTNELWEDENRKWNTVEDWQFLIAYITHSDAFEESKSIVLLRKGKPIWKNTKTATATTTTTTEQFENHMIIYDSERRSCAFIEISFFRHFCYREYVFGLFLALCSHCIVEKKKRLYIQAHLQAHWNLRTVKSLVFRIECEGTEQI